MYFKISRPTVVGKPAQLSLPPCIHPERLHSTSTLPPIIHPQGNSQEELAEDRLPSGDSPGRCSRSQGEFPSTPISLALWSSRLGEAEQGINIAEALECASAAYRACFLHSCSQKASHQAGITATSSECPIGFSRAPTLIFRKRPSTC